MANKDDILRERQRKVSKEGEAKEKEVIKLLLTDEKIRDGFLIGKSSKVLKDRSDLYITYDKYKEMIDADICIVRKKDNKLVCVISVKKSFRERGGQTAYWAVKIKQSQKEYKYILATPDKDKELFNLENPNPKRKRKWRIILPYECDAVFIYSYPGKVYEDGNFYVGHEYLINYIRSFL